MPNLFGTATSAAGQTVGLTAGGAAMAFALALAALGVAHSPLPTAKAAPIRAPLWYSDLVENHYLPLAACQMGLVRFVSDCVGQSAHPWPDVPFDTTHAFAMVRALRPYSSTPHAPLQHTCTQAWRRSAHCKLTSHLAWVAGICGRHRLGNRRRALASTPGGRARAK